MYVGLGFQFQVGCPSDLWELGFRGSGFAWTDMAKTCRLTAKSPGTPKPEP